MSTIAPQDQKMSRSAGRKDAAARLLQSLRLAQTSDADQFIAPASGGEGPRMFGGHLMAQAIVAAGQTTHGGRVHSVQATFLRPGDRAVGAGLGVTRLFDGRSYRVRQVVIEQGAKPVMTAVVSFHEGGDEGSGHAERRRMSPLPSIGSPVTQFSPWSDQAGNAVPASGPCTNSTVPPWIRAERWCVAR